MPIHIDFIWQHQSFLIRSQGAEGSLARVSDPPSDCKNKRTKSDPPVPYVACCVDGGCYERGAPLSLSDCWIWESRPPPKTNLLGERKNWYGRMKSPMACRLGVPREPRKKYGLALTILGEGAPSFKINSRQKTVYRYRSIRQIF